MAVKRKTDTKIRKTLITGYPLLIAKRLSYEILARERGAQVTAVVQEKHVTDARKDAAKFFKPDMLSRLTIVTGDIVNMHLGLSSDEYNKLIAETTDIYHLAAISYLGIDESAMRAVNVNGTRNMLEFASDCRNLNRFNYFSTCFVSGDRVGVIREDELEMRQSFRNAYEKTKYEAELIVERRKRDLPISIYRPSIMIGDSRTGEIDRFTEPYYLAIAMLGSPISAPLPLVGDGSAPLNVVPTDYVVRAMHAISRMPESRGKTFHLVDPNPISVRNVYQITAAKLGRKAPLYHIPSKVAILALKLPALNRYFPSHLKSIDYIDHLAIYNCANTSKMLAKTGIICPSFEEYVDNLIAFVKEYYRRKRGQSGEGTPDDQLA